MKIPTVKSNYGMIAWGFALGDVYAAELAG